MIFCNEILNSYICMTKEKGDKVMCQSLNKIIGKTPEEILEKTGQTAKVPVDISAVLRELHISEIGMEFSEMEKVLSAQVEEKGAISGMVLLSGDNIGIFYNEKDSINRQRFTLAHELAHCCLNGSDLVDNHIYFRHELTSSDIKEVSANTYAGKLLIPEQSLRNVYEQLTIPVVDSLAKIFQVSKMVMRERLTMLKMNYFDTDLNKMVIFGED